MAALPALSQVDIFLCSDELCSVAADLVYLDTRRGDIAQQPSLSLGYARIPGTLMAAPFRYFPDGATARTLELPWLDPVAKAGHDTVKLVSWALPTVPEYVQASPVMFGLGAMVRSLGLTTPTLEGLRWGRYPDAVRGCVAVITFVHPWMDSQVQRQ